MVLDRSMQPVRAVLRGALFGFVLSAAVGTQHVSAQSCSSYETAVQAGTLLGSDVDEASGLVASRSNANILWTHNDDANDNRLFALRIDGTVVGTFTVGSGAQDPEDIAIGPGPQPDVDYLYWGDIGDNNNVRSTIVVRRVPEPIVSAGQNPVMATLGGVETIVLAYPTGPTAPPHRDAETLLVDPLNQDIYVITKRDGPGLVYRAAAPHDTTGVTVMTQVAVLPWNGPVGGDVSADGAAIIVRRYSGSLGASVWFRPAGTLLFAAFSGPRCDVPLQAEPQGEAICFTPTGYDYYTVSENQTVGAQIPIWYFQQTLSGCTTDAECTLGPACSTGTCQAGTCTYNSLLYDLNGDGATTVVGDLSELATCFFDPPGGIIDACCSAGDCTCRVDCTGDGSLTIVGDLPCWADCFLLGTCVTP